MTAVQTAIDRLIQAYDLGIVIATTDIDSIAAGALTSVKWLRNANWGSGQFQGTGDIIHRPGSATAADNVRYASTLTASTGVLAPDANWADTTLGTEYIRLIRHGLHPQWILDSLNRALETISFQNQIYPSLAADADMQSTATSSYTEADADGGPATTFTKESTLVFTGIRSGKVVGGATGGYIRQRFNVERGEQLFVASPMLWASGTACGLYIYDVTNSAYIGTATSNADTTWQYHRRLESAAATTKQVEVRWLGEGTDTFYVDGAWVYRTKNGRLNLPSSVNESFEFEHLTCAYFPAGNYTSSNVYSADAIQVEEIPSADYSANFLPPEANPSFVQFHLSGMRWLQHPLILQGRRKYSDLITVAAETDATGAEVDLWVAATAKDLFETHGTQIPNAAILAARGEERLKGTARRNTLEGPARRQRSWVMPRVRN